MREKAPDILFPVEICRVSVEVLVQFEVDEEQPEQTHSGHFTLNRERKKSYAPYCRGALLLNYFYNGGKRKKRTHQCEGFEKGRIFSYF